jgi:hypothetical protein
MFESGDRLGSSKEVHFNPGARVAFPAELQALSRVSFA